MVGRLSCSEVGSWSWETPNSSPRGIGLRPENRPHKTNVSGLDPQLQSGDQPPPNSLDQGCPSLLGCQNKACRRRPSREVSGSADRLDGLAALKRAVRFHTTQCTLSLSLGQRRRWEMRWGDGAAVRQKTTGGLGVYILREGDKSRSSAAGNWRLADSSGPARAWPAPPMLHVDHDCAYRER